MTDRPAPAPRTIADIVRDLREQLDAQRPPVPPPDAPPPPKPHHDPEESDP